MKVKFMEWTCVPLKQRYTNNNRLAIELVDAVTAEPITMATVNLNDEFADDNEVFIKDYSENTGIRECLEKAGVIGPVKRRVPTGFVVVTAHDCLI